MYSVNYQTKLNAYLRSGFRSLVCKPDGLTATVLMRRGIWFRYANLSKQRMRKINEHSSIMINIELFADEFKELLHYSVLVASTNYVNSF